MNFNFFVVILALIAASHSTSADPVKDAIVKLLRDFTGGCAALKTVLEKMNFDEKGMSDLATQVISKLNSDFLKFVEKSASTSGQRGQKVLECLKSEEDFFDTAVSNTVSEVTQCMGDGDFEGLKWYMEQYVEGLQFLMDNLNTYATDLDECTEEVVVCIIQVFEKNHLYLIEILGFLGGRVIEIAMGLSGLIKLGIDAANCVGSDAVQNTILSSSQKLFEQTIDCILPQ